MTDREVRLRCIEAAAKAPIVHPSGPAVGLLEVAQIWADWVIGDADISNKSVGPITFGRIATAKDSVSAIL